MKRISSSSTFFFKKVLPAFWIICLAFFLGSSLWDGLVHANLLFVLMPLLTGAILFYAARHFLWNLADEVTDGGDHLRVRRGSVEERIALSEILNVSVTFQQHPPRVALRLDRPGKLGDEISILPAARFRKSGWRPS